MSLPGWTEFLVVPLALLALAGCSIAPPKPFGGAGAPVSDAAGDAPPALLARYDSTVSRLHAGDDPRTVAELETLSGANPGYAGPLMNLALVRARAGDDESAFALLEQGLEVCSRCAPIWNEIGVLHRQQGRFADAEAAYRRAIEMEPDYALAHLNLAIFYELYGQRPELALDTYRRYLELIAATGSDSRVAAWVADLERRVTVPARAVRTESLP